MDIHSTIPFLLLFPLICALSPTAIHFIGSSDPPGHQLCNMGCKCPPEGQSFELLDCSRRSIRNLPSDLRFEYPVSVVSFQSNLLSVLRMSTFSMADSVEELDLSQNQIHTIENSTFMMLRSLALLKLSHNHLPEISPGLLAGLHNLRILEIGHNTIQKMSAAAFATTPDLQELRLQYNPIFNLPENVFQFLAKLQRLDLQDTGLVRLPSGIFKPTPQLQWLSLSTNAFETVPEEALSHAHMLESLDLSGNDFTNLVRGDFRSLRRISQLYLNNLVRLTRIEKEALAGLEGLKSLSCSFNPNLVYIDEGAFGSPNSSISKVRTSPHEQLYLRQNALRTLKSPLSMDSWSTLSFVDLADNPWSCDCKLLWMRQLKKETQMNIICDSPPHLRGRPLGLIKPSELMCENKWALATFILTISAMVAFGLIVLATSAVVCSRTRVGLYVRAKRQFAYAKVVPKTEVVDLEWDPSADV